jgi:hypothetical protein
MPDEEPRPDAITVAALLRKLLGYEKPKLASVEFKGDPKDPPADADRPHLPSRRRPLCPFAHPPDDEVAATVMQPDALRRTFRPLPPLERPSIHGLAAADDVAEKTAIAHMVEQPRRVGDGIRYCAASRIIKSV